jgi:hypothetical protein
MRGSRPTLPAEASPCTWVGKKKSDAAAVTLKNFGRGDAAGASERSGDGMCP